jgi:hypothetical protein
MSNATTLIAYFDRVEAAFAASTDASTMLTKENKACTVHCQPLLQSPTGRVDVLVVPASQLPVLF